MDIGKGGITMQERLTRPITESEIKLFNPTRPSGSKYSEGDYVEKRDVTDLECYRKLGQLEDIEEDFGITWDILFQACTKGFWNSSAFIEPKNNKITKRVFFIDALHKQIVEYLIIAGDAKCPENRSFWCYKFEDYGKKTVHGWALTKEELK